MTTSATSTSVVGVMRLLRSGAAVLTVNPFGTSALRRWSSGSGRMWRRARNARPEEGDDRRDQPVIDRVLHALGERGGRLRARARRAELRERNAGEVAHLGAAGLVLAVDALDVGRNRRRVGRPIVADLAARELMRRAGRGAQPPLDLLLEVLDGTEQRGAGRTDVAAGRDLAVLLQMDAELALRDLAERIIEVDIAARRTDSRRRSSGSRCRRSGRA